MAGASRDPNPRRVWAHVRPPLPEKLPEGIPSAHLACACLERPRKFEKVREGRSLHGLLPYLAIRQGPLALLTIRHLVFLDEGVG